MTRRWRSPVALAVLGTTGALLLTACGGSSSPKADGNNLTSGAASSPASITAPASTTAASPTVGGTSSAATVSPSATAPALPSSPKLVAINIQRSDLPATWTASTTPSGSSTTNSGPELTKCVGGADSTAHETGTASSAAYSFETTTLSSSASSYSSAKDVANDVAILKSPKLPTCFEQIFRTEVGGSLPAGTTLGTIKVTTDAGSAGGPSNVVAHLNATIPVVSTNGTQTVYAAVAFITGPLIECDVDAFSLGVPVPTTVFNQLVAKVAARAAKG